MTRRRFFRVTSLTLLILCLAAWGWSFFAEELIECGKFRIYFLSSGTLCLYRAAGPNDPFSFNFRHSPSMTPIVGEKTLGFWIENKPTRWAAVVPWWFPTLLLAALTWWSWRKTRAKDGRGFAVEQTPAG